MSHIHTDPGHHDLTASGFIVRIDQGEPKLYLHMHKKLNKYLQFGGHVELHENPWEAVTHEILEESGYEIGQLDVLQPKSRLSLAGSGKLHVVHPTPLGLNTHQFGDNNQHFHTDISFALVADQKPKHKPADDESDRLELFTRGQLAALPPEKIYDNVRDIGLFIFDECLKDWDRVPAKDL